MISISTVRWLHRHPDDVSQSSLCKVAGIPTLVVFRRETGEIVTKEARGHIDPNDVQAPWSTDCCSMYLLPTVPHANDLLSWPCEGGLGRVGCWRRQLAQGSRACQCSIVGLAIVSKANRRSIHPGANTAFFDLKFIYCWYTGHRAERWGRPDVFRVQRPLRHAGATWNHSLTRLLTLKSFPLCNKCALVPRLRIVHSCSSISTIVVSCPCLSWVRCVHSCCCALQMLSDLLGKCTEQWEAVEGAQEGNDLPGWTVGDMEQLGLLREMMRTSLERLAQFLEHAKQGGLRSQEGVEVLNQLSRAYAADMVALPEGESTLLPGGWRTKGTAVDTHVWIVVTRTSADTFAVVCCNRALDGLQFHPSTPDFAPKHKYKTCLRLEGIPQATIADLGFITFLLAERFPLEAHRPEILYESILPWVKVRSIVLRCFRLRLCTT